MKYEIGKSLNLKQRVFTFFLLRIACWRTLALHNSRLLSRSKHASKVLGSIDTRRSVRTNLHLEKKLSTKSEVAGIQFKFWLEEVNFLDFLKRTDCSCSSAEENSFTIGVSVVFPGNRNFYCGLFTWRQSILFLIDDLHNSGLKRNAVNVIAVWT